MGFFFIQCHVIFTIAEPSNLKSDEKGGEETESGSSGEEGPSFSVRRVLHLGNSSKSGDDSNEEDGQPERSLNPEAYVSDHANGGEYCCRYSDNYLLILLRN